MRNSNFPYLPRDFIQTQEGLLFAVVCAEPQDGKVGCFLRYMPTENGWQKVNTDEANRLLKQRYRHYCYTSAQFDATFHGVATDAIISHYQPENRLKQLLKLDPADDIEQKLHKLVAILARYGACKDSLGVTGSMLINQQWSHSDIDLVVYGRDFFLKARKAVSLAIADAALDDLDIFFMRDHYDRRLPALSFAEFAWHERRKLNKAVIDGCKFDLGMVCLSDELKSDNDRYYKQGTTTITARVVDDLHAFDFPARYRIDNGLLPEILAFTHTYVGQAKTGELIEAKGTVEHNQTTGQHQLIVGSSREALGDYIKVINR